MQATIMVVEDEPDIRELVTTLLTVEGFTVLSAEDGPDALRQLSDHPEVDLLFTDIVMPGELHGFDLARRAREIKPGIKLLYTSGFALSTALRHSGPVEDGQVVAKPYRLEQLVDEIRRTLAG